MEKKVRGDASHRKAILTGLIDLDTGDARSVSEFECLVRTGEPFIPRIRAFAMANESLVPSPESKRLVCAQKLVSAILDALCGGTDGEWMRLETALREIETPRPKSLIMKLRARVVEALRDVWIFPGWRRSRPDYVIRRLSEVDPAFSKLDPAVVIEAMDRKTNDVTRAAILSVSVGAFGDDACSVRQARQSYHEAWKAAHPGGPPPGSDPARSERAKAARARRAARAKPAKRRSKPGLLKPV